VPNFSANIGFLWADLPMEERFAAAAAAGFRAIEAHWPFDLPPDTVAAFCADRNVTMLAVNTPTGDAEAGERGLGAVPGREADFRAGAELAVNWVSAAGGNAVHAMAGVVPRSADAARTLDENLKWLGDLAGENGLTVLLEGINHADMPGYYHWTCAQVSDAIDRSGRDNVKMMFDAYHVARSEGHVEARLKEYFSVIGHIQIAGAPARREPDEGEVDYAQFLKLCDDLRYAGWIGCEYRPRGDTDAGLAWVEALGFRL